VWAGEHAGGQNNHDDDLIDEKVFVKSNNLKRW
jgi:hypothetical protein